MFTFWLWMVLLEPFSLGRPGLASSLCQRAPRKGEPTTRSAIKGLQSSLKKSPCRKPKGTQRHADWHCRTWNVTLEPKALALQGPKGREVPEKSQKRSGRRPRTTGAQPDNPAMRWQFAMTSEGSDDAGLGNPPVLFCCGGKIEKAPRDKWS
ncbi:hypothetical protein B0T21DRAFT_349837 [Apiosordaria backusii]|uniref:Secreted protein n=1 Tax=Apiosordaria backusii TaxID=314023 RepID=A0AA40BEN8_9PEZI|nr:hypothetical protein B0T21DRAFT_349837 [Apiosordaria backusii]